MLAEQIKQAEVFLALSGYKLHLPFIPAPKTCHGTARCGDEPTDIVIYEDWSKNGMCYVGFFCSSCREEIKQHRNWFYCFPM